MNNANLQHRWIIAAGLALIVVGCIAAYIPAIRCGYIWDDDAYVLKNQTLRSVEGLGQIWFQLNATPQYYPIVHTTYWLEYRLWGLNPAGFHVVNILLHVFSALLLWRVLTILRIPGAWLAAAVFALHPVHVESVAWITERKNVLSGVFYLGAMLAYLRYALVDENGQVRSKYASKKLYAAALVLFLCALLSKTVTSTLPAVLLLVIWWKRKRIRAKDAVPLVPFFVVGIVLGLLTAWLEKHQVGATGEEWGLTFLERGMVAGRIICFYVSKLFWPTQLTFIYPRWQIDSGIWWQYLFPAGVAVGIAILWLARGRIGAGALVAALCFVGTLFPALGFFDVFPMRYSYVADHFQYLASLGVIVPVVAIGYRIASRLGRWAKMAGTVLAVCLLVVLGTLTWRQCPVYKDLETLWLDTIGKNPNAWIAYNNLGNLLQSEGRPDEAIEYFRQSLKVKPDDFKAHYNLGNTFYSLGRFDEAVECYSEALRLKPNYIEAINNLAYTLAKQGKFEDAVVHYRKALQLNRDNAKTNINLAYALMEQGKISEAIVSFEETLRLDPDHIEALNNLAWVLAARKDAGFHDAKKAIRLAKRACELTSYENVGLLDTLAVAYAAAGKFDQAIETAQRGVQLADSTGKKELAEQIKGRLQLYRAGKPYIEPVSERFLQ